MGFLEYFTFVFNVFSHFHFGLINAFNREGPIYLDDKITFENIHTNVLSGIFISLFIFTVMLFLLLAIIV